MSKHILWPLLLACSATHAFTLRDQGYFDIGLGPEIIEEVKFGTQAIEFYPGPALQTSVGLCYKNGLGLGLTYRFNYNGIKDPRPITSSSVAGQFDADEFFNSGVVLNFSYKLIPTTDISVFFHGGPALVINTDTQLKSTAQSAVSETSTTQNTDATGATTGGSTVSTSTTDQAADPYETHDNLNFGYQIGGGIEYREDNHKAYLVQFNYLNSQIAKSNYNTGEDNSQISSVHENLESMSTSIIMRYYL